MQRQARHAKRPRVTVAAAIDAERKARIENADTELEDMLARIMSDDESDDKDDDDANSDAKGHGDATSSVALMRSQRVHLPSIRTKGFQ